MFYSFHLKSAILYMLKGPFIGRLFSLPGVKIEMVSPEVVKLVCKERGKVVKKSGITEFPSINVSFRMGENAVSAVESYTDQLKLLGKTGRGSPFARKGPFTPSGNEMRAIHPSADIGRTPVLPVTGHDIECHHEITCIR